MNFADREPMSAHAFAEDALFLMTEVSVVLDAWVEWRSWDNVPPGHPRREAAWSALFNAMELRANGSMKRDRASF